MQPEQRNRNYAAGMVPAMVWPAFIPKIRIAAPENQREQQAHRAALNVISGESFPV